ncbi:MAG: vitamin B12 dependent-methionine synthase activation domain-containing protein [Chloroflexota bacterium]|nr:vitamin B12 dependent-methionine synthase activation domain-containing protein [Chloroflexota bacterium]
MVETIADLDVTIGKKQLCRRLGYWNSDEPRASISTLIEETIEEAHQLIEPSCTYQIMDVQHIRRPRVTLVNGAKMTVTSDVLSWVLYPCEQAAIFACSIGPKVEEQVARLTEEGYLVKAMILDAIGSEAVEQLAGLFQDEVQRIANKAEAEITNRYSPGYCDWDIKQQKLIFKNLEADLAGISLSDECLMKPRKSISGIIGIGWTEKRRLRVSPCRFCTNQDCKNRR